MSAWAVVAVIIASYAVGTFPTAQLVGARFGFDPTAAGSGNPGASNTTRIGGVKAGAMVLIGDAGKGALAAGAGYLVDGRTLAWCAGAAAVLGHIAPITRRLQGGKGVATMAGVGLVCAPLGLLAMTVTFGVLVKVTGKAAVGSIVCAALVPVAVARLGQSGCEIALSAVISVAVIARHRDNIRRLRDGTESAVRSGTSGPVR